jgi:CheY-like chemotaxis protein
VITDVKMPGMSGIEFCNRCDEYRTARSFLVIVLTSQLDEETHGWIERSPHRKYLPKPFSPREVLRIVDEYIASRPKGSTEKKEALM